MSESKKVAQEKIAEYHAEVGQVPDRVIAEKADVSLSSVRNYRLAHGIPAAGLRAAAAAEPKKSKAPAKKKKPAAEAAPLPPEPEEAPAARRGRKSKVEPFAHLLGQVPDRVIAEKAGVGVNTVHAYRKRHGIVAAGRRNSEARKAAAAAAATPAPAATPTETPAASGPNYVWQVLFKDSEEVAFVVASGLVDAAAKAQGASNKVLGVEMVGRVL